MDYHGKTRFSDDGLFDVMEVAQAKQEAGCVSEEWLEKTWLQGAVLIRKTNEAESKTAAIR